MRLNYLLTTTIILSNLLVVYSSFSQAQNTNTNQSDAAQYFLGLRKNSPPISAYDGISQWTGYCEDFRRKFEDWMMSKKHQQVEIKPLELSLKDRLTGKSTRGHDLDLECGNNTINNERKDKLKQIHAKFSDPFAFSGAKVLVKNENIKLFYQKEPFKDKSIGVYGNKNNIILKDQKNSDDPDEGSTTTGEVIDLIFTSAKEFKPVVRRDAFAKLGSNEIFAYATDEIILRGILDEVHKDTREKYAILPYFRTLTNEPYGIVVYNSYYSSDKNASLLVNINDFINDIEGKELAKDYHLDDSQNNFWGGFKDIYYYLYYNKLGFLIAIITLTILILLLTYLVTLFVLIKFMPTIVNTKLLDRFKKKANTNESHDLVSQIFFTFFTTYQTIVENLKNIIHVDNKKNDYSRNITIDGQVDISGPGALSLGDISGIVANTINQLPSSSEPDQPGIKELLGQLKTAIESESSLSNEHKVDALEHVQTLAEAGQKPQEASVQKPAKVAIQALKGIFSSFPDVAKLADASKTLIPLIAHIFGL